MGAVLRAERFGWGWEQRSNPLGAPSNQNTAQSVLAPVPATVGTVTPTDDPGVKVSLAWADVAGSAVGLRYDVYFGGVTGATYAYLGTSDTAAYDDSAAAEGVENYYKVKAVRNGQAGALSAAAHVVHSA